MAKFLKYSLKTIGWFLLILIFLFSIFLIVIQTKTFKEKIVSLMEEQSKKFINGDLTFGSLDGNFFTHLILKDVLLKNDSDTLVFIKTIDASYLLVPLLQKKIILNKLHISNPSIHLHQINDSIWNVQQIMKQTEGQADTTNAFFEIKLNLCQLIDGAIIIHSSDTLIPHRIQRLNSEFSFQMMKDQFSLQLKNLSLLTIQPDLELKKLSFKLTKDPNLLDLADITFQTVDNQMKAEVQYHFDKKIKSTALIQTSPLNLKEFKYYMPSFKSQAAPVINARAFMLNDSVNILMNMTDQEQKIDLKFLSSNLYKWFIEKSDSLLNYKIDGKLQNVQLLHWTGIPRFAYILNGQLLAEGEGTDPHAAKVKLNGIFENCIVENKKIDHLYFDSNYDHGNLNGFLSEKGSLGMINLRAIVNNILNTPDYHINLTTTNFNAGPFTGIDTLNSALNLTADISGRGIDPKTLSAKAAIEMSSSRIQNIHIQEAKALVDFNKEDLQIDSLWLLTQSLSLKAKGNYSLESVSDLSLTADLKNMDELAGFIPVKDLQSSGHLVAHLTGTKDSMNVSSNLNFPQTQYGEYSLGQVLISGKMGMTHLDTILHADIIAKDIKSGDFQLDSASFNLDGNLDSALIKGHLVNKDVNAHFQTALHIGTLTTINLYETAVNYKDQLWVLTQPPASIEIGPKDYRIRNLNLGSGDMIQHISAEGIISREGNENLNLQVKSMDIKKLAELSGQKVPVSGSLNLNLSLGGNAAAPLLKGDFGIDNAVVNNYNFSEFGGKFDYKKGRMGLDMNIVPKDSGNFTFTGNMPFRFRLDSMSYDFNRKDSLDLNLDIKKFPLAALGTITMIKKMTGFLEGGVRMLGSIDSPDLKGNLQLKNAAIRIPEYGVDYRNMILNVNFIKNKVQVDTLSIRTDKGFMTGKGDIDFSSDFYKGNISNSKINLRLDGFKPINHRQVNMQVTGNATLGGATGNVVFDGNMQVDKSEIYIPALLNMVGKVNQTEMPQPLLARALDSLSVIADTLKSIKQDTIKSDTTEWNYFKDLKGKLRFKIPKNTWIKNENMYVEISGDLELIKNLSFFELFGNVKIMRGQYELLGRKFVISKGNFNFEGGEEMLPQIDLEASYVFRNTQRIKQTLTLDVNGLPDSLAINFRLDDNAINEGDALSYLLFGRGLNELSLDQQQGVGNSGSMAEMVAASLVSSQLTKFLGDKLNVDYLEIKSEGGFENATVTVGKYITRDLFASYEQRFGQTTQTGQATYVVNLEYEIFKFLFLQMNNSSIDNGFDVIFKIEAK